MYLVKTSKGDKIVETADEVKNINKYEILGVYSLVQVDYDDLVSTADVRDQIYEYLKGNQILKEDVLAYVSEKLDIKKSEVSKVITSMKKEKIIYTVKDDDGFFSGYLGID